ncbi:MAG: tetratricopeptide repeat protein [Candidatus Obscuribacterales bacterium]|nr:tetratricopeptide repeat protein [Candidatus Obscuribacterales bacterium]
MKKRIKPGLALSLFFLLQVSVALPPAQARHDKATVEPTELHMKDGLKKMKLKDYEGAADEFLQACYFARNKYCPEGWLNLGICYKKTGAYTKAIEALNNHLSQTTEKAPDAHVDIAECYMNIGDLDKAERHIQQARIDADFKNKRPYFAMGELYEKMNRPGDAMESYTIALGDKPWTYTEAWLGRARMEIKITPPRYNDALKDYKELIDSSCKNVDWVEVYFNMANCLYKRGDHQGAIDHLLQALKENPDHYESHLALGHIFDEEKHITSAVNQYESALRTAPKGVNTDELNKRIIFLQGQIRAQEKDKEVKPSPYMRQEQAQQEQASQQQKQSSLPAGESGF